MRRFIGIFLSLLVVLVSFVPSFAGESRTTAGDDIVILTTNDVHCAYKAYSKIATLAKDADLLFDAGDFTQGDLIGTLSNGEYLIDIMNYVGYDAVSLGNHEFDYGMDVLLSNMTKAEFSVLALNVISTETGEPFFESYRMFEAKGKKIAVIGIDTPETLASVRPELVRDEDGRLLVDFLSGNSGADLYKAVQDTVSEVREKGADFVIVLGHLGISEASSPWTSEEFLNHVEGIDVFVDGHSHSVFQKTVGDTLLYQTGTKAEKAGRLVLHPDGTKEVEFIDLASVEEDAETVSFLETISAQFSELTEKVIGTTEVELTINKTDGTRGIRSEETNAGDFVADAIRDYFGAEIGVVNGGTIRTVIPRGTITYGDLYAFCPYTDTLYLAEITGSQLLDALEVSCESMPSEFGGYYQVSGLSFTVNTAIAPSIVYQENGDFERVEGSRRVSDVLVNGVPIDPERKYRVAGNDYTFASSGAFSVVSPENITILEESTLTQAEILIHYLTETLGGTVGTEYEKTQGRIHIVNIPVTDENETAAEDSAYETGKAVTDSASVPSSQDTFYTVQAGDCLWGIARKLFGDGLKWDLLYSENKGIIKEPRLIFPGQVLTVPALN